MFDHVNDAAFVDIWAGMWLMANDQCLLPGMEELTPRTRVVEHLVAQGLKHRLELAPLEIRGRRTRTQSRERLQVLGHCVLNLSSRSVTIIQLRVNRWRLTAKCTDPWVRLYISHWARRTVAQPNDVEGTSRYSVRLSVGGIDGPG